MQTSLLGGVSWLLYLAVLWDLEPCPLARDLADRYNHCGFAAATDKDTTPSKLVLDSQNGEGVGYRADEYSARPHTTQISL